MTRLAALDLGTNTVRVLVVDAVAESWRAVHQAQRVTRLGAGQATAGRLLDDPMRRTVDAVADLVAVARRLGAQDVHIAATSAVREASNRDEFLARVRAVTGEAVEVLSGEDEARLTLLGVSAGLPALSGPFVVVDVGGGSTELVRAHDGRVVGLVSMPLGVVRLAERFMDAGAVARERLALMRDEIERCLSDNLPADPRDGGSKERAVAAGPAPVLVGTAGTITTLAAFDLGLPAYDPERVYGHRLTRAGAEAWLGRLSAMPVSARAALPCVERGRADLLVPGIAICVAIMEQLGHDALVVSDQGLREGLVHRLVHGF